MSDTELLIEQYNNLKTQLNNWSGAYYNTGQAIVEDSIYDANYQEFCTLADKLNLPNTLDAPVGADIPENTPFAKIQHIYPMLSLQNTFSSEDLENWVNKLNTELNNNLEYSCELKLDGVSISLVYNHGELQQAITRGNGNIGEDVTHNIKTIRDIPQTINCQESIIIRGEIYMKYSQFEILNNQNLDNKFANPRNLVSGSIRLLDSKICEQRNLSFMAYECNYSQLNSQQDIFEFLINNKFTVNSNNRLFNSLIDMHNFCTHWTTERHNLDYPTDGLVIKINNFDMRNELGNTSKFPKWATAYKFPAESNTTQILNIEFEIGRTGQITPVANLLPVLIAGTIVKRASVHNLDQLDKLNLKLNDWVNIHKAGEIIPEITEVIIDKRPANSEDIILPTQCPICNADIMKPDNEVAIYCSNYISCPAQVIGRIEHWAKALDIKGLGHKIIDKLYTNNIIQNIYDLYTLTPDKLSNLEGFKDKSINNLLAAIEQSKSTELHIIIYGLGIRNIGQETAKLLVKEIHSLDNLLNITDLQSTNLLAINGIGKTITDSLQQYIALPDHQALIKNLNNIMQIKALSANISNILNNQKFVITGNFEESRKAIQDIIEQNGGTVMSSVSKNTNYLLAGENAGSKLTKATSLNIKIINWQEFQELIQ